LQRGAIGQPFLNGTMKQHFYIFLLLQTTNHNPLVANEGGGETVFELILKKAQKLQPPSGGWGRLSKWKEEHPAYSNWSTVFKRITEISFLYFFVVTNNKPLTPRCKRGGGEKCKNTKGISKML